MIIKELDLKQFLKLFWDRKVFIVIMMILFGFMGCIKVKFFTTPVYEASGKMICARNGGTINQGMMVTTTELSTSSSLSETYAELIKSDLVVAKVIENLKLDVNIKNLSRCVELVPLTKVYYQVNVRSTNKEEVAKIANEFMKVFSEEVEKFYEIDGIYVVDEAIMPQKAVNMSLGKNVITFAIFGCGICICMIMITFIFNTTVTNAEQIKKYTKLTTLASIPRYSGDEDLITVKDSKSPYAESVKILRTNLQYMYDKGDLQTVAITSSLPGEGKSWLTANLAVAFANSGKKTLIIDADMRRGRQHKMFKVKKMPGLAEFLKVGKESTQLVAVRGKRVAKTGIAKILTMINQYIKIEKIPKIANMIYKEEYMTMTPEDQAKVKSLKKENNHEQLEIVAEEPKKAGSKISKEKTTEEEKKTVKKGTKKTVQKKETDKKETKKVTVKKKADKKETTKKATKVATKKKTSVKKEEKVMKISDFINPTGIDNLYVLPAGIETMESSELLASGKLEEALQELKKEYDMILVDTPPVSVVADGFIIARIVDTNMIVLKHGNTEINELNKIKNNIQEIGGEVIGTVINKIPDRNKKYYHTYYNKKA